MKALFCLYSAPLIESVRASSTPLAGNLRRGRVQGQQRSSGEGQGTFLPLGQASQELEFGSKHQMTVQSGDCGGCPQHRYPAPCKLGEWSGCYEARKGASANVRNEKGSNMGGKSAPTLPQGPRQGANARKTVSAQPHSRAVLPPSFFLNMSCPWGVQVPHSCTCSPEATLTAVGEQQQTGPG